MDFLTNILLKTVLQVWTTFTHNWPFLLVSVLIAVALKLYLDADKVSAFLIRYRQAGVIGATVAAVATPLCSCGTTAIVLAMMAGTMPWAPIVAFMVASPLTSPEGLVYSAGLFGWPFAVTFYIASILLGLLGGLAAGIAESRGWLNNQARLTMLGQAAGNGESAHHLVPQASTISAQAARLASAPRPERVSSVLALSPLASAACACSASPVEPPAPVSAGTAPAPAPCGCGSPAAEAAPAVCGCAVTSAPATLPLPETDSGCGCGAPAPGNATARPAKPPVTLRLFLSESFSAGRHLLVMFFGFAFIGYFLNSLIPQSWVATVFGSGSIYSVPLAATLGLPLYINSEASLPLVRALLDGGMSQGAALAFLITGAGTSVGALAGALTIARWRVIALVVGTLWIGAVIIGNLFNLLLAAGWV